ncbi:hypothetical protein HIM_10981 [Hirsutella minnesotensis 3608]|uniref:Integrase catalytic domain-containing protein n=1 Tax=Hirsutella minnesotensis 3608 TaxID=1043627 RepID=A0A0F7ZRH4_9HYPO|nr:hypothetical protein HIM_10981 [Hirsutella minnesotensis 3608]
MSADSQFSNTMNFGSQRNQTVVSAAMQRHSRHQTLDHRKRQRQKHGIADSDTSTRQRLRTWFKTHRAPRPFWRVYIDIFSLHTSYNGKRAALLVRDEFTGLILTYLLANSTQSAVIEALEAFAAYIKRQWNLYVCVIHRDNDPALKSDFTEWVVRQGIEDEPTAPYTPAQNGPAERSGGVISTKARTMQIGASLPAELWPETWQAATYLHNRSPQQAQDWKTPFEKLQLWLQQQNRDTGYAQSQPDIAHLKAYGCKAYPLTKDALKRIQRKDLKTAPQAEIGYLVGYESSNIFRIWIPTLSEVRRVRDVTFDERSFYDPKGQPAHDPTTKAVRIEIQLPKHIEDESECEEGEATGATTRAVAEQGSLSLDDEVQSTIFVQGDSSDCESQCDTEDSFSPQEQYITPAPSQLSSSFGEEPLRRSSRVPRTPNRGCFASHTKASYFSSFFQGREEKLHRRSLPPEPRTYKDLQDHRFGDDFKKAAEAEWQTLQARETFREVPRNQAHSKPLPLTWVFKYKFDKHGFLTKFKARLCVRGDLQQLGDKDTYAATLAGRSFRILMAITAKFDLETRQLDAVNAFTNSFLDEDVFVMFPDGYHRQGWTLKLIRALYGLRRSPLLWQKDLTAALQDLGLTQCPDDPCIFQNPWMTVFFFVDDIVLLYRKGDLAAADQFIQALKARYDMTDQGELQWFLGIRVIRDREARKLWLCQDSYIEKVVQKYDLQRLTHVKGAPYTTNELKPRIDQASADEVKLYQGKIGSINYPAVITRPDVAKAASKLAEFLLNPSDQHQKQADKLIEYLYATRYLAIQFSGTDKGSRPITPRIEYSSDCQIASDASFADDPSTRKSSQGSIVCLFGGPISWQASKQATVTTSSTEAELLAFTHTAKETIATYRLFKQLSLQLDDSPTIQCDNLQTIRLINSDLPRLRTALRHVDIHSCWARQAYQDGLFRIEYTPTSEMLADGLTKLLPGQKLKHFVQQLGLVDIRSLIKAFNSASSQSLPLLLFQLGISSNLGGEYKNVQSSESPPIFASVVCDKRDPSDDEIARSSNEPSLKRPRLEQSTIPKSKVKTAQELSVGFVIESDVPFTIFEHGFLKQPFLHFDRDLAFQVPWSSSSVSRELRRVYESRMDDVRSELARALTSMHLSFDLWTSPNRLSIMAVFAHFIDRQGAARSVLLAMRRQLGTHSGENLADTLGRVVREWEIESKIGTVVSDNLAANDTCLHSFYKQLDPSMMRDDIRARRMRCYGHILNLVARAFLFGQDADTFEVESEVYALRGLTEKDLRHWRTRGPIGKLHNIVKFTRSSPQRSEQFRTVANENEHDDYCLHEASTAELEIMDNDTRWNSTYLMIERALRKQNDIRAFLFSLEGEAGASKRIPADDILTNEDWRVLAEIGHILMPLYLQTMRSRGRGRAGGSHGHLWEVLMGVEFLLEHLEEWKALYTEVSTEGLMQSDQDDAELADAAVESPVNTESRPARVRRLPARFRDDIS